MHTEDADFPFRATATDLRFHHAVLSNFEHARRSHAKPTPQLTSKGLRFLINGISHYNCDQQHSTFNTHLSNDHVRFSHAKPLPENHWAGCRTATTKATNRDLNDDHARSSHANPDTDATADSRARQQAKTKRLTANTEITTNGLVS